MSDPSAGDAKVAALRQEIAQTRAELGETVEALAAKADVKARARARARELADETRVRARELADETRTRAQGLAADARVRVRSVAQELRTEPAVPVRRGVERLRTAVRENPRGWAVTGAVLVTFALLIIRRRRSERGEAL